LKEKEKSMKARTGLFLLVGSMATAALFATNTAYAWPTCPDGSVANQAENGRYVCPTTSPQATSAANAAATAAAQAAAQAKSLSNSESNAQSILKGKVEGTVNGKIDNTSIQKQNLENSGNSKATGIGFGGTGGQGGEGGKGGSVGPVSATGGKSSSNLENVGNSPSTAKAVTGASTATTGPVETKVGGQKSAQQTTIDTSDRSVNNSKSMVVVMPPVVPPLPPVFAPAGDLKQTVLSCGPLQVVGKENLKGHFIGLMSNVEIPLGQDHELLPYVDKNGETVFYLEYPQPDGSIKRLGHEVVLTTGSIPVSGARQFGLGGFNSSGGGQVGGGASGTMAQIVSKIILRLCELPPIPAPTPTVVTPPPPAVVFTPPPVVNTPPPQMEPPQVVRKSRSKKKQSRSFQWPKPCDCTQTSK
jgi:hypothetical protein